MVEQKKKEEEKKQARKLLISRNIERAVQKKLELDKVVSTVRRKFIRDEFEQL